MWETLNHLLLLCLISSLINVIDQFLETILYVNYSWFVASLLYINTKKFIKIQKLIPKMCFFWSQATTSFAYPPKIGFLILYKVDLVESEICTVFGLVALE
jgi:hypothetical protein